MKTKPSKTPEPGELRQRALGYLARREHSRFELAKKLGQAGFGETDIAALLDEFEARNWLSDQRFAESWVTDHKARSGSVKLAYELHERGVDEQVIATVLATHSDSEVERARKVWQKKFAAPPKDLTQKAQQMRFLLGRGFSQACARQVLETEGTER